MILGNRQSPPEHTRNTPVEEAGLLLVAASEGTHRGERWPSQQRELEGNDCGIWASVR